MENPVIHAVIYGGALAYLPKNTVLTCYTGYHYPLKATFEYGGDEWILFLAPRVENWYAESFEAESFTKGQKDALLWFYLAYEAHITGNTVGQILPDEWKIAFDGHCI